MALGDGGGGFGGKKIQITIRDKGNEAVPGVSTDALKEAAKNLRLAIGPPGGGV